MLDFFDGLARGMGWGAAARLLIGLVSVVPHVLR
jgi:hypothetical protein